MNDQGFDIDLVLEPRRSAQRAWIVASVATAVSAMLTIAIVVMMPLKTTEVFTVLVDSQTGAAERIVQVAPTGIQDEEAIKQSLLVAYVNDREGFLMAGIQERLESVQRRSAGSADASLREIWSSSHPNYPPRVYGQGAEVFVTVRHITFLEPLVAQIRFEKTLRRPRQEPVTRPFVATVAFEFNPRTERSLQRVWENPLGFTVTSYRVDAETLGGQIQ